MVFDLHMINKSPFVYQNTEVYLSNARNMQQS